MKRRLPVKLKFPGPSLERRALCLVPLLRLTITHTIEQTFVPRHVWSPPNDLVRNLRALGSGTVRDRSPVRQDQAVMSDYRSRLVQAFLVDGLETLEGTAKLGYWFGDHRAELPQWARQTGYTACTAVGGYYCDAVRPKSIT